MQKSTPRSKSRMPWLFLLLIPLSLVGLDAFGWIFPKTQPSDFPLQGIIPVTLPAQTPQKIALEVRNPTGVDYQMTLKGPETDLLIPGRLSDKEPGKPQLWQSHLPALATGTYLLRIQPAVGSALPVRDFTLQVQPEVSWQAQLGLSEMQAGDLLPLTVSSAEAGNIKVELRNAEALLQSWDLKHQLSLTAPTLVLPTELPPAEYQLEVNFLSNKQTRHKPQKLTFQITPEQRLANFQVSAASQVLLKNQAQTLHLWILNRERQPLASGWVRIMEKNWPVKAGRAEVHLQAEQITSPLVYSLGDAQGNLFQGEMELKIETGDWLLKLNQQRQPYLLARKALNLHYLIHKGSAEAAVTGLFAVQPGENELSSLASETPQALYLVDEAGQQQALLWPQSDGFTESGSTRLKIKPATPNALQALTVSLAADSSSQLAPDAAQTRVLVQAYKSAGISSKLLQAPPADFQALGFPEAKNAPFGARFCWLLLGLLLVAWPGFWLQKSLLDWVKLHRRPFPNPVHLKALKIGRWTAFSLSLLGCCLLMLSWVVSVAFWSIAAVIVIVSALTVISLACWQLRKALPAKSFWIPLIQLCLASWCLWFVLAYAPAMMAAVSLAIALLGVAWMRSFVFLRGEELRQSQGALLALASLTVMAGLQVGILCLAPTDRFFNTQANLESDSQIPPLLDWQPQAQLIHQSVHAASNQMMLPALQESGELLIVTQAFHGSRSATLPVSDKPDHTLLTVRPAVLARLTAPTVVMLGDQLQIPVTIVNPLTSAQTVDLKLTPGLSQSLDLAPRTQQSLVSPFSVLSPGWNTLTLAHRFEANWYTQQAKLFGMALEPAHQDDDLRLQVRVPQAENLVPEEEIPVLVRFQHHLRGEPELGLQIGLPAGFTVLTDTLQDSANADWLAGFEQNAAYLNLRTKALKPGKELSFHFRLRAGLQGKMKMPPSRLLVLDQPDRKTVLAPIQMSVKALN